MLRVLKNPTYAKLFGAQIIALIGTGLLTVALGLLAFDIAGGDAGVVMGVAMSIKMIAYVAVSPVMIALVARLPKRPVLIAADLVRAGTAVALPFVTEVWQIYVLIFILQSASATFTPTFQAVIPSILPDEGEYTRALSLSRLAYDLESVVSPMLAAALLTVISYNNLFVGTVVGFVVSAILVTAARLPAIDAPRRGAVPRPTHRRHPTVLAGARTAGPDGAQPGRGHHHRDGRRQHGRPRAGPARSLADRRRPDARHVRRRVDGRRPRRSEPPGPDLGSPRDAHRRHGTARPPGQRGWRDRVDGRHRQVGRPADPLVPHRVRDVGSAHAVGQAPAQEQHGGHAAGRIRLAVLPLAPVFPRDLPGRGHARRGARPRRCRAGAHRPRRGRRRGRRGDLATRRKTRGRDDDTVAPATLVG